MTPFDLSKLPVGERFDPQDDVQVFPGIVKVANGPPGFGEADEYTYDVYVNMPDNPSIVPGLSPVMERWSGNVVPIKVDTVVMVGAVRGHLQLMARELPHLVDCGGSPVNSELALLATLQSLTKNGRDALKSILEKL